MRIRDALTLLILLPLLPGHLRAPIMAAHAHNAPEGWQYPYNCCAGQDCRPVTHTGILKEKGGGFWVTTTQEFIPYGSPKIKVSPDSDLHWCSVGGKPDGDTICIFAPPKSF